MSNKIFTIDEILKELENTPLEKSHGNTVEYLLMVLNKDINNKKYNSASKYIADKINQLEKSHGNTVEYLLMVLNKDINNKKYNSASKYIADKINQYTQKIFENLSGVKLNKNIEGSLIIIDNYTGAINTQYYKIKPKDLDEAINLFNSMNKGGFVYYYFKNTTLLQKMEANYIEIDYKRTFIRDGVYITSPIVDIRVLDSDMSIGAKLLYDKYIKAA